MPRQGPSPFRPVNARRWCNALLHPCGGNRSGGAGEEDGKGRMGSRLAAALNKNLEQRNAVCTQAEGDDLERDQPGYHLLVRSGITTEGEAQRLALGTSRDPPK